MTVLVSDYMLDIRAWLRTHPDLAPLHGGRVFFRIPQHPTAYPLLRIFKVSGGIIDPYTPDIHCRIGLHVWGNSDRTYTQVRALATAIESSVWQVEAGRSAPGAATYFYSAAMNSMADDPDPETGFPRMVGSVEFFLRMAGTADP